MITTRITAMITSKKYSKSRGPTFLLAGASKHKQSINVNAMIWEIGDGVKAMAI